MTYSIQKTNKGWAVICPDGRKANDWDFDKREDAEKKLKILLSFYRRGEK